MPRFKFKLVGKVNKWDALFSSFTLGTPGGHVEIITDDTAFTDQLIEAMKTRDNIVITIGEED